MGVMSRCVVVFKKYPLLRGMASYAVIWPTSSLIQQTFEGKNIENYDWMRCARYGLYGSCYVAPTLYSWLTVANIMWPGSSLRVGLIKNCQWMRCARYGLYGSCYVAPTLYSWLTVANIMWPGTTLRVGLIKTFVETLTYTPFAMCSFYFGMSLLEMKPLHEAMAEVKAKFWPTYKVGASIWPAVALVNFCLIPPRNRVPFISCCSLIWTCFLAYMKHLDKERVQKGKALPVIKITI